MPSTPQTLTQAEALQKELVRRGAEERVSTDLVKTTSAIRATREAITYRQNQTFVDEMGQIALRAAQTAEVRDQAVLAQRTADSLVTLRLTRLIGSAEARQAQLQQRIDSLRAVNTAVQEQLNAALTQLRSLGSEVTTLKQTDSALREAVIRETSRGPAFTLGDALFDAGKTTLKKTSAKEITRVALALKQYPGRQIAVEAHMDAGPNAQRLSELRATTVRAALVKAGVDPTLISARGLGATQPLVEGATAAARRPNRRVDVQVLNARGALADSLRRP